MDKIKLIKTALLLAAIVSVCYVDWAAGSRRQQGQLEENQRDLQILWEVTAELVKVEGFVALPIQEQAAWESLDVYAIDADSERFETVPRFEPTRGLVESMLDGNSKRPIKCETPQVELAQTGNKGVGVFPDYRGMSVISAYGLVHVDDRDHVLLVEMDESEAIGVAPPSYWDEFLVSMFCLLAIAMIWLRERFSPAKEIATQDDSYALVTKLIRFFPDDGIALVTGDGVITECNTGFAKMFGGLGTRDFIGTNADQFADGHAEKRNSFKGDIVERPVEANTLDGGKTKVLLSVTKLNGTFLVRTKKAE